MQFIIIAKDGTDADALQRRLSARDAHINNIEHNRSHMLMGAAMLNDDEQMNGSVMVVEFPSREDLDQWFENEPYVTHKVWDDITIIPCKVAPTFLA